MTQVVVKFLQGIEFQNLILLITILFEFQILILLDLEINSRNTNKIANMNEECSVSRL